MKKHYRTENDCLNCGTILQGHFCHVCGQENLQIKESFGHMMNHAISDYFHFDHQFFHTLKPLFLKPGYLTNEYMAGHRAQYLHPVKMYIFISIVYFLVLFQSGWQGVNVNETADKPAKTEKGIKQTKLNKELDSDQKAIAASPFIPNATKKQLEKDIARSKAGDKNKDVEIDYEKTPNQWFHPTTMDTTYQQYLANQQKLSEEQKDGFLERTWNKKVYAYRAKFGPGAKEEFLDDLKHNTPKMMFLLLPLLALMLQVTFFRNKKFYVEHLIYTFHLFCFLFLFLTALMLLQMLIPHSLVAVNGILVFLAVLYICWYIYRSLRVVYHRSIFRTITKLIGMSLVYLLAFTFCISLLFIVTTLV